jgi:uridine phosphorylase
MTERYITPEKLLAARFEEPWKIPRWDAAILCFRDKTGSDALVETLPAVPVGRKIFWGIEEADDLPVVYAAEINGKVVGIVTRCIWGGHQASILIEELAAMGVGVVVGYGAAGSLDPAIGQGRQLVVTSAIATDGTSSYYGSGPFSADSGLLRFVPTATPVVAATTDAVYRETPGVVAEWKALGASVVNMESAPFYAASAACGMRAIWLGMVTDVISEVWQDWFVDQSEAKAISNCLDVIRGI